MNEDIDCWWVQFKGLEACKKCELNGTKACYGTKSIKEFKQGKRKPYKKFK